MTRVQPASSNMRFVKSGQPLSSQMHDLVQALVLRRGVELVQNGLRPPSDVTGLPQGVVELLRSSPSRLAEAVKEADARIEAVQSAIKGGLHDRAADPCTDWSAVDAEAAALSAGPGRGDIAGDAREEAVRRYREIRFGMSRAAREKLERALHELVAAHVKLICVADLVAGRQPEVEVGLRGDQLVALGQPDGAQHLRTEAVGDWKRRQDELMAVVSSLAEQPAPVLADCDQLARTLEETVRQEREGSPRRAAVEFAHDAYLALRRKTTGAPDGPLAWLFTWRGRVTRLQYVGPALCCEVVLIWLLTLLVAARHANAKYMSYKFLSAIGEPSAIPVEQPSRPLVLFVFVSFCIVRWVSVVLDIRRIRDMGRNALQWMCWIWGITLLLIAGSIGAFASSGLDVVGIGLLMAAALFSLAVHCVLFFGPSKAVHLPDVLGSEYRALRGFDVSLQGR